MGWGGMDWIHLAKDMDQWRALVNMVMNILVSKNVAKFLTSNIAGSLSKRAHLQELFVVSLDTNLLHI
jgi:hypothetical protein